MTTDPNTETEGLVKGMVKMLIILVLDGGTQINNYRAGFLIGNSVNRQPVYSDECVQNMQLLRSIRIEARFWPRL